MSFLRNENIFIKRFAQVYSSLTHNSPQTGNTQKYINWRMDKQIVIYSYNGILLSNKKNRLTLVKNITKLKNIDTGAPGWLSRLSVQLWLIS